MNVHDILDWIILIGAAAVALGNIIKFFAKPTSLFKKKANKELSALLKSNFQELMPSYLEFISQKERSERNEENKALKEEILAETKAQLDKILEINEKQSAMIDRLEKSNLDILRQRIENIYYKYADTKRIPRYVKENLDELYQDYIAAGGNHHIPKLYKRIQDWDVIDIIPEYDRLMDGS